MNNSDKHIVPIDLLTKHFANECSEQEILELHAWRDRSPENSKEFKAFEKLWNITGDSPQNIDIDLDAEWNKMESAIEPQSRTLKLRSKILQIAASIVLISTLAFIGVRQLNTTSEKSGIAEASVVILPDGSSVKLNAGSKITYAKGFGSKHRNLILKGEAFFKVQKNAQTPFIISANESNIEVVGTQFNVKAYKDHSEVRVAVTEGRVELYAAKQAQEKTILSAGETGMYNKKDKTLRKTTEIKPNELAWITQIMEFNNTPLSEVVDVLTNTYHINFLIDPAVLDCPITVQFKEQDLSSVLNVLQVTLNLKISQSKNKKSIIITGTGCN